MEHTKDTPQPQHPGETSDLDEILNDPEKLAIRAKECDEIARAILRQVAIEDEERALNNMAFSLEMVEIDCATGHPAEFANMLTSNTRVLDAAFKYYLKKAHKADQPDQKIRLAFAAQSQLVRSIETWKRIAQMQIGGTK